MLGVDHSIALKETTQMMNVVALAIVFIFPFSSVCNGVGGYEISMQQASLTVQGISVYRVPLRNNDPKSPYTFAASVDCIADLESNTELVKMPPHNFLATQVWPSARTAAIVIEKYLTDNKLSKPVAICEFGCGPGLPSLTAALCDQICHHVIATDIDPLALALVRQAAIEQNVSDRVTTQIFDLVVNIPTTSIPPADIYIFSDVFENGMVAKGAAQITMRILNEYANSKIWVFAQSDRAQREIYLTELRHQLHAPLLEWSDSLQPPSIQNHLRESISVHDVAVQNMMNRLWLFNIDETHVFYG